MIVRVIKAFKMYKVGQEIGVQKAHAKIYIEKGLVEDINNPKPKKVKKVKEVKADKPKKKTKKSNNESKTNKGI